MPGVLFNVQHDNMLSLQYYKQRGTIRFLPVFVILVPLFSLDVISTSLTSSVTETVSRRKNRGSLPNNWHLWLTLPIRWQRCQLKLLTISSPISIGTLFKKYYKPTRSFPLFSEDTHIAKYILSLTIECGRREMYDFLHLLSSLLSLLQHLKEVELYRRWCRHSHPSNGGVLLWTSAVRLWTRIPFHCQQWRRSVSLVVSRSQCRFSMDAKASSAWVSSDVMSMTPRILRTLRLSPFQSMRLISRHPKESSSGHRNATCESAITCLWPRDWLGPQCLPCHYHRTSFSFLLWYPYQCRSRPRLVL